ncbi:hypothetical protein [uncultured Pseudacidovorax sp.]|uniref:hypothetical protein n=1 Tax=uncultured Pseudacidovorax sp. TaxID=679313 RepID=UPI0025FCF903|nr:hypothetical protein [uncultured Pseudacidovorax sp.]
MTAKPLKSTDNVLAAYEGALPTSLFAAPTEMAQALVPLSPDLNRHLALEELGKLAKRIPQHTEAWARVRQVAAAPHLLTLWLSKDAERFLELLAVLAADVVKHTLTTSIHPRLRVIFAEAATVLHLSHSPERLLDDLRRDPWGGLGKLDDLLALLRRGLHSRAQIERELQHERREAGKFARLRVGLSEIARAHPEAVVLRVELYRDIDVTDLVYPGPAARAAAQRHSRWLQQVRATFGSNLVHVHQAQQRGDMGDAGTHVMLIVKGQAQSAIGSLQDQLLALWKTTAGHGARGIACKGPGFRIYCRGRQWPTDGDSLKAELADAALYFFYCGGPVSPSLPKPAKRRPGSTRQGADGVLGLQWHARC